MLFGLINFTLRQFFDSIIGGSRKREVGISENLNTLGIDFRIMKTNKYVGFLAGLLIIPSFTNLPLINDTLFNRLNVQTKQENVSNQPADPKKEALTAWIEKLAKGEGCPVEGLIDSNHKLSYGDLCFQEATFKGFVKKYNMLPDAEDNEYMNLIGDGKFQRELTYKILTDKYENWRHWECTVQGGQSDKCYKVGIRGSGIGLPPKI